MKKVILATAALLGVACGSANATPSLCSSVAGNLFQNCGFETGDLSNWNPQFAATGTDLSVKSPGNSGSFAAYFGGNATTNSGIDQIHQFVPTIIGHTYQFEDYFKSDGLTPNGVYSGYFDTSFHFFVGFADLPAFDWIHSQFTFIATTPNTGIYIGGRDTPGYLEFDDAIIRDVSVPEPFTLGIFGAGLAGAFATRRRKQKSA